MDKFKTYFFSKEKLPMVIEPKEKVENLEEFLDLVREKNHFFKEQILKYGGLLFRNFPVNGAEEFSRVIEALNTGEQVDYIGGGSPRTKVKNKVYTSTDAPPAIKIHLHNELSFSENYPSHIYFYCDVPPDEGGETFIADARKVYQTFNEKLMQKFDERGLKYVSRYYHKSRVMDLMNKIQRGHKKWSEVFETETKEEVEQKCSQNNIGYKWNQNDWLEISRDRPASMLHPITKEKVWFNQVHLFDYNPRFLGWWRYVGMKLFYCRKHMMVDEAYYADGEKIPRKDIYAVVDNLDKNSIYFPWQKGDVMVLDNILAMHGRAPFKGKRRILTAMTK